MRRKDREITDDQKIAEIIRSCDCCRLGLIDNFGAYVVPLNFAFCENNHEKIFYFHSTAEGKKIDLIKNQNTAFFELDSKHKLVVGKTSCSFGYAYQCVMGRGSISLVNDIEEKKLALKLLMGHYDGNTEHNFSNEQADTVAVIRLVVNEWSCKQRI